MRRSRDTSGVTLPELLIAVTILTVIMAVLGSAAVVFLRNQQTSDGVFSDDNTARFTQIYFTADVQAATSVVTTSAGLCGTGTPLVTFGWVQGGTAFAASWYAETEGERLALVRRSCEGGTLDETHDLGSLDSTVAREVVCTPDCAAPTSVALSLAGEGGYAFTVSASPRST